MPKEFLATLFSSKSAESHSQSDPLASSSITDTLPTCFGDRDSFCPRASRLQRGYANCLTTGLVSMQKEAGVLAEPGDVFRFEPRQGLNGRESHQHTQGVLEVVKAVMLL